MEEFGNSSPAPKLDRDTVIQLTPEGRVFVYWQEHPVELHSEFDAWGSGGDVALGALYCGKSAVEAVEIACKVDVNSGLPVNSGSFK